MTSASMAYSSSIAGLRCPRRIYLIAPRPVGVPAEVGSCRGRQISAGGGRAARAARQRRRSLLLPPRRRAASHRRHSRRLLAFVRWDVGTERIEELVVDVACLAAVRTDEHDDGTIVGPPDGGHAVAAVQAAAADVVEVGAREPVSRGVAAPVGYLTKNAERRHLVVDRGVLEAASRRPRSA